MLARHLKKGLRVTNRTQLWRMFSTEAAPEEASAVPEPTEAEKVAARD